MQVHLESQESNISQENSTIRSGWMKFGLIAAASAVLGGMATAWWYRNTLIRLRQGEETALNPQFGISEDDPAEES